HPLFATRPPTTPLYTLPLHDALPISQRIQLDVDRCWGGVRADLPSVRQAIERLAAAQRDLRDWTHYQELAQQLGARPEGRLVDRSEEHTSELQSRENLVCRLLLEKKK